MWKEKFAAEMSNAGHDWYAEARSSVLPYIGPNGSRQTDIVAAMGISKQAVQQLILDLEKSDILRREPDPNDGRGKIVHYTEKGFAAQQDIQNAKRKVEEDIKRHLGEQDFEHLMTTLRKLGSAP